MSRRKSKLAATASTDAVAAGAAAASDPAAADGEHVAPREGEWYAPQGDDNSPAVDYFSDNRGVVSRTISIAVISVLVVATVSLGAMWFAAPMLETRINV